VGEEKEKEEKEEVGDKIIGLVKESIQ